MTARRFLPFLIVVLLLPFTLAAQIVPIVSGVKSSEVTEGQPMDVTVELSQNLGVTQVLLVYRPLGASEFREIEMALRGRVATGTIPAEAVRAPSVEYYVRVLMVGGKTETYPVQNPESNPLRLAVKAPDPKDQEVRIISPEPGAAVAIEELGIVISFFYASPAVNPAGTRILLNSVDVSKDAVLSDDLLIYAPQNFDMPLKQGAHTLTVELVDTTGKLYHRMRRNFTVTTAAELAAEESRFRGTVDGQLELRDEALASSHRSYVRGDLRASGMYSIFQFGGLMHLDNQDKPTVQPQNRFNIFMQTDWLRLEYGDAYPRFPSLMVSGKRVRGFSASLSTGVINIDVSTGETARGVEGIVDSVAAIDTSTTVPPNNSRLLQDTTYEFFRSGTFRRKFFAVRTSFGSHYEGTQFGLGFVKAKDDVGSILRGTLPQENLVIGADFRVTLDDERFRWETQTALSLTNTDISGGSFTQADYDQFKASDPETGKNLEDVGKIVEKIITVNEYLFPSNPVGKGLPSISLESSLNLNYLNNYLTGLFFRRGASYVSFGNDFLQTDVQGFLVSDRIRMFDNRVYLSLSYERKQDNTADTKEGTTTFGYFNSSLTVSPVNFPSFTLGFGFNDRIADFNAISGSDSSVSTITKFADETTNRFYVGANHDFTAMGNRQSVALVLSIASKKDRTFYRSNQDNMFLQLSWTSEYRIPLQTVVGFGISNNKNDLQTFTPLGADSLLTTTEFNYTSVTLGARYRLLGDKLRLAADVIPIFGAISRVTFQAGGQYAITQNHHLELFFSYIQNSALADDMISSLIYRFNF